MKIHYSISLKLTLIVVLLPIIVILFLSSINIYMDSETEKQIFSDTSVWAVRNFAKSHAVLKSLDEELADYEILNSTNLHDYLTGFTKNYSEILKININTPYKNGLIVNASTDNNSIGTIPDPFNNDSFNEGHTYYIVDKSKPFLTIISPINISVNTVATYEILISMYPQSISHDTQIQYIVIISFISIFVLIIGLLFLLRKTIVNPIVRFRDTTKN